METYKRGRFSRLFSKPSRKAEKAAETDYLKELTRLHGEIQQCDDIVSGGRAEVANDLPNWTIEQYYRALLTETDKAEKTAQALKKQSTPTNGRSN